MQANVAFTGPYPQRLLLLVRRSFPRNRLSRPSQASSSHLSHHDVIFLKRNLVGRRRYRIKSISMSPKIHIDESERSDALKNGKFTSTEAHAPHRSVSAPARHDFSPTLI